MRLIDADALKERAIRVSTVKEHCYFKAVGTREIDKAPTIDATPVAHGWWQIFDDGFGCELMCCSVCKSEFYDGDNDTVDQLHNYCPHCGAKMDGEIQ